MNPEDFKNRIIQKYPDGKSGDGRPYKDIDPLELTRMVVNKHPSGVTNDGIPYRDFLGNNNASMFENAESKESSFIQNIKDHWKKRVDTAAEAQLKSIRGEQSTASGALQTLGEGAGLIGDVVGESIVGAGKLVLPESVEEFIGQSLSRVGESAPVEEIASRYNDWKAEHTEAAENLESVVNLGGLIPIGSVSKTALQTTAKGAGPALRTSGRVATAPVRGMSEVAKTSESLISGIPKQDIEFILNNPGKVGKAARESVNREAILADFKTTLDDRLDDLSGLGSQYEAIRKSDSVVQVPNNWLPKQLENFGIKMKPVTESKLNPDGTVSTKAGAGKKRFEVVVDTESVKRLDNTEQKALNRFVSDWADKDTLTANEFLNLRRDLSKLSKFERQIGKSSELESVAKQIRKSLDKDKIKDQIPGLRDLDEKFAPEIDILNQLKRDIYNPDGTLKDGAANKIANAIGTGKGSTLARMETLEPDLRHRLELLRTVESIEKASSLQTGTYIKGAISGAILYGGGISPATVVGMILAFPQTAVPLMQGLGYSKAAMRAIGDTVIHTMNKMGRTSGPRSIDNPGLFNVGVTGGQTFRAEGENQE